MRIVSFYVSKDTDGLWKFSSVFHIFSISWFKKKSFFVFFWSLCWMLSLKTYWCFAVCQCFRIEDLSWCEALWLWWGNASQAVLLGDGGGHGLFHGETLHLLWAICLLTENSVSWENIVWPPALGYVSIWLLAFGVCDWKGVTGSEEGWRFLCSVDRHHSFSFLSLIAQPRLPMCLKCLFLKSILQGGRGATDWTFVSPPDS